MLFKNSMRFILLTLFFINVLISCSSKFIKMDKTGISIKETDLIDKQEVERITKKINDIEETFNTIFKTRLQFTIELVKQNETDACIKIIDGKEGILLNDKYIKNYLDTELAITLSHEYFHIYQNNKIQPEKWNYTIVRRLYEEGSACFAPSLIISGMEDWKYISPFRNDNKEFIAFEKYEGEAKEYILTNLYSKDIEVDRHLFSGNMNFSKPWPPRIGYYFGYKLIKKMYQQNGMKVFQLSEYEIIKEINNEL